MNKSEELAKLLEIEPALTYSRFEDLQYPERYNKPIYPDLSSNSNFLELLHTMVNTEVETVEDTCLQYYENLLEESKDKFIEFIIARLKTEEIDINLLKNKIKQVEWDF